MSEVIDNTAEIEALKARAEKLGIAVDGRWGVEKLREVVNAAVAAPAADVEVRAPAPAAVKAFEALGVKDMSLTHEAPASDEIVSPVAITKMPSLADAVTAEQAPVQTEPETPGQKKNRLRREAMALVRVRVSCMDPQKKNLKGELICVSNRNFGSIQRFVPFNREWHIEKVLYDVLMEKEYMVFDRTKTGRAGIETVEPRNVPAFNIQVLPPLTKTELKDLAQRQAMADGTRQE